MPKQASLKSTLAGIFFLGLSVILFEIALTRVFAIMMWHHFTYMVISIGLLGFGASGSLLTATRIGSKPGSPARGLVLCSLAYGVSVMLAFCFATLVRIDSLAIWQQKENFLALFFIYLVIGVPFLLGGMGIGLALTRLVKDVNKLYCGDLVGSAIGAGLSVLLLKHVGGTASVMMAGAFGLVAAFCFSLGAPRRYLVLSVPGLLFALFVAIGFTGGASSLGIPAAEWRIPYAPGKEAAVAEELIRGLAARGTPGLDARSHEFDKIFSATAEVEVGPSIPSPPMIGGDQGVVDQRGIESRAVGQDGTAPTMLFRNAADLALFPFLDDTQAASAYVVHKASGRSEQDVMVIGVGGGVDVMVALANGARSVTAVELNTAMIEMVTQRYDEYLGGLFRPGGHALADRIKLRNSEGRAWLRSHDDTYDVIQMSGVDSYTALSTGAYTLSESYLYTTQAVADFYAHLNENGIVNYSRFIESAPQKPRETLRLANIACTSLRELGVADPASHIGVFQGLAWASTMVKKGPFTAGEVQALRDFARREGFVGLVFDPLRPAGARPEPQSTWFAKLRPSLLQSMARLGGFPTEPAAQNAAVDALFVAGGRVLAGAPIDEAVLPEELRAPALAKPSLQLLRESREAFAGQASYIAQVIGEFTNVLRGEPAERERFVADYEYDISPSTDDRPFFFNYYRWSSLFGRQSARIHDPTQFTYTTDFPVGHMVLLASLVQILLLAAFLIFLPLRKLAHEGLRAPGAVRYFAYFAALGLGFMLFEIALMQKLVIFLGHPTYALSVVLVSLLASAGLGSLLAGRIEVVGRKHLLWILLGIVAVGSFDTWAVNAVLPHLLGRSLEVRMLVVVLLLVPTGFVLGMPFPSGMRLVEAQCPHLVPWGWAVNAFFSVFGSIFCIVLSMQIGFTNVLLVAIGVYALGLLGMKTKGTLPEVAVAPQLSPALWVPPGHFYSPIPDPDEVRADEQRIFSTAVRALPGIELDIDRQLALARELAKYYGEEDFPATPRADRRYCLANDFFPYSDAFFYHALLRHLRPRRMIEIGSGWSSAVLLDTDERFLGRSIQCTFIEPHPERLRGLLRPEDVRRTKLLEARVQDVPLEEFDVLQANDILFVDSSHVCKTGSDVHHILFEILPRLPSGVWVHFHDIFHNFEYLPSWVYEGRAWNESYMLRAFLTNNREWTIELHGSTLATAMRDELLPLMPKVLQQAGGSIWLEKR